MRYRATWPTTTETGLSLADPSAVTREPHARPRRPTGAAARGRPQVHLHGCVALSDSIPVLRWGQPERAPGLESSERASGRERVRRERGGSSCRETSAIASASQRELG